MTTLGLTRTPKNVMLANGQAFTNGTAWTWDPSGLEAAMPAQLNQVWDRALAAMGTKDRVTHVLAAIAATRTTLANSARKLQGTASMSGFSSALKWGAGQLGGEAGTAVGTAVGGLATAALAPVITTAVATVSTAAGVSAGTAVAAASAAALGAATAGIGAVAVLACVGIADAVASLFDTNCCDHNSCDWSFDYRFGGRSAGELQEASTLTKLGASALAQKLLSGSQSTFPDPVKMKWDDTIDTFAYVVARLDWDTQAAVAGSGCPGPDLGAGPLLAASVLAAWKRAHLLDAPTWRSEQPAHLSYVLQPNEAPGSTFLGYDGFSIMLLGLAMANGVRGDDMIQFQASTGKQATLFTVKVAPHKAAPKSPPRIVTHARVVPPKSRRWGATLTGGALGAAAAGPLGLVGGLAVGAIVDHMRAS